jgi:hypothetical protein
MAIRWERIGVVQYADNIGEHPRDGDTALHRPSLSGSNPDHLIGSTNAHIQRKGVTMSKRIKIDLASSRGCRGALVFSFMLMIFVVPIALMILGIVGL